MNMASSTPPEVSVVVPIFGSHRAVETIAAVCGAWLEQDVPCEVIIASAGQSHDLQGVHSTNECVRVLTLGPGVRSLSALRNAGAAAAHAPMLYLGDGDVAPLGQGFLRRALEVAGRDVLIQPWMYRVVNARSLNHVKISRCPSQGACFVRADADGDLVPVDGERFEWRNGILWVHPPQDAMLDDPTSLEVRVPFHWGGILVSRQLFDLVGGYCEQYIGWGGEDDDLLFKLASRSTIRRAWWAAPDLKCLHAEHPRPTITEEVWRNRRMLAQRVSTGVMTMIDADSHEMRRRRSALPDENP